MKIIVSRGFSLIELLVAMFIASVILVGVVNVVMNGRVSSITEQEASYIQENARYATELLTRDIRIAGSMGCAGLGTAAVANTVDGDLDGMFSGDAITGFEGKDDLDDFPAAFSGDATVGTDSVILRYADPDSAVYIQNHTNYNSATLKLYEDHSWEVGDKLMIVDPSCRSVGIFEVAEGGGTQIKHQNGKGVPGNCTKVLYATTSFTCSDTPCNPVSCGGNPAQSYGEGATVMSFVANAYYIGESTVLPGMPALKRRVLTSSGSQSEELAQGVEDMELLFGINSDVTDSDNSGDIDFFVTADEVDDWSEVAAVRYNLTLRSQSEVFGEAQAKTINGVDYDDRYLRQFVSSTVRIRNRGG